VVRERSGRKGVIPLKRGNKEGNKRRIAQTPDEKNLCGASFIEYFGENPIFQIGINFIRKSHTLWKKII